MFKKRAEYKLIDAQPLNAPNFSSSFIKDQNLIVDQNTFDQTVLKIASQKQSSEEKTGDGEESQNFDLKAEIETHPDSLFVKCFAIKADETNDNGDHFSKDELIKATPTFVGVPLFTNHANTDINEARGKVVHSWWDEDRNGIMIIGRVDAAAYPQLARGIKEKYILGTSMGCQVAHSVCSVCHNMAETPDQYCGCIRERKTRVANARRQKCEYFKRGTEEKCPICASTKDDIKTFDYNGKVFEYNFGIKFIENSFVVNPACPDCGVTDIIDTALFQKKVAELQRTLPRLLKAAQEEPLICTDGGCIKIAGQQEIDSLNQALDLLSSVSEAMLKQKEQIDLEFLSDLVKVLADLQAVTDELTEQGYGRLQSPGQAPASGEAQQPVEQGAPTVTNKAEPLHPTPGGGSKIHSGPAGQVGNVTSPMASNQRIDLTKFASQILHRMKKVQIPNLEIVKKVSKNTNPISVKKTIDLCFSLKD